MMRKPQHVLPKNGESSSAKGPRVPGFGPPQIACRVTNDDCDSCIHSPVGEIGQNSDTAEKDGSKASSASLACLLESAGQLARLLNNNKVVT